MTTPKTGYAPVNGLQMYYEVHGEGQPLVLLHGAFSAIGTSFGKLLPALAKKYQAIGVDLQGHGRTADIERPLRIEAMADDIAALLKYLNIERADVFGYSMGAGVALLTAIRHPEVVRKLAVASVTYSPEGMHPGLMEGMSGLKPEHLMGSPWQVEYATIAPRPEDFSKLVSQVLDMNRHIPNVPAETMQAIKLPMLIIIGDSDIVRPEHAVEMFRLVGGGVSGDNMGMPTSQLAILPGTSHVTVVSRDDLLLPMLTAFLDAPMPPK